MSPLTVLSGVCVRGEELTNDLDTIPACGGEIVEKDVPSKITTLHQTTFCVTSQK
jgi:hypothetical protein